MKQYNSTQLRNITKNILNQADKGKQIVITRGANRQYKLIATPVTDEQSTNSFFGFLRRS